jgi:hypothetical protein
MYIIPTERGRGITIVKFIPGRTVSEKELIHLRSSDENLYDLLVTMNLFLEIWDYKQKAPSDDASLDQRK